MKRVKKPTRRTLSHGVKSFLGHLSGVGNSANTIQSYRLDLLDFMRFLEDQGVKLSNVTPDDIERKWMDRYHSQLRADSQRANTRRRKLLTLRRFFSYLQGRKWVASNQAAFLPTPEKVERVPQTANYVEVLGWIRSHASETDFELRNQVILWTLFETGASVSEIAELRQSQLEPGPSQTLQIRFIGKVTRTITLSRELSAQMEKLIGTLKAGEPIFSGYNRFGKVSRTHISSRGVELLVKAWAESKGVELTPRMIRHTAVLHWYRQGMDRPAIRERLGLLTDYTFRIYEPLFQSQNQE